MVYLDGEIEIISANVIDENLLSQVYEEGYLQIILDKITDYRGYSNEIKSTDRYYKSKYRN